MTDSKEPTVQTLNLSQLVGAELGQALGWDTQRTWATGVQVFVNPDHVLFVFKEQIRVEVEPGAEPLLPFQDSISRNVASVVMPVNVATALRDVLNKVIPDAPAKDA